jgi:hypothetical protein
VTRLYPSGMIVLEIGTQILLDGLRVPGETAFVSGARRRYQALSAQGVEQVQE